MGFRLDHLVILVDNLQDAIDEYRTQGYLVQRGGTHTDGATANALIGFADGTYLELLAFLREAPEHRWGHHPQHGPGLIDVALLPSDIAADIAAVRARGVSYTGPFDGGRQRLDGEMIRWQSGLPPSSELPFFCADVTPRERRVPSGADTAHPNGVRGIRALKVACRNRAATQARYEALLGGAPAAAGFVLGGTMLELHDATDPDAAERLARRGEGVYAWEPAL